MIDETASQPSKIAFPIFVTDLGMVMDWSCGQDLNALSPMCVMEFGILTSLSSSLPQKAAVPIDVTSYVTPL